METTVTGYLAASTRNALSLVIPCEPCASFHWHGAGTVEQPLHRPGDVTDRETHCPNGRGSVRIRIAEQPYSPGWVTPHRGRLSSAYRREVA